jgi:glycosidase
LRRFHEFYKHIAPDALTVGEVWDPVVKIAPYIEGGALDLAFEFDTAKAIIESVNTGSRHSIALAHALAAKFYPPGQFAPFITNHDQNRAMSQLGNDWTKAKLAAFLLLTSPGVPFIYYGEEIGMTGRKPDERLRTPMQWSLEENAGFTAGKPWERVNPDFKEKNVQTLSQDLDSLLNFYRKLIGLRNAHEALRVGDYLKVKTDARGLYAFLRHSDDEDILVLVNLSEEEVEDYRLDMKEGPFEGEVAAVELLHRAEIASPAINDAGGFDDYQPLPTLPARTGYIIQLQP